MEVKVKRFSKEAVIPKKVYPSDFCYDVTAISEEEIAPNVWKYGLGLAFQIERGFETLFKNINNPWDLVACDFTNFQCNLSIDLRPRSSVWKTGMVLSNCEGTIDENYINEVSAIFYHVMPNMPRYKIGDRIGQIKIGLTFPIDFVEVDELEERDRGMNGLGSTGK